MSPAPAAIAIVGLTGGIGSGKSAVADLFARHGVAVVDTDQIAHQLSRAGGAAIPALRAAFGNTVLTVDGALDRAAMRARVFAEPAERARLEAILHPMIRAESMRLCAAAQGRYVILAVPLLLESGHWRERCQRVLVVDCPEALQISRVMQRSGLTESAVRAIMASQATREQRLAIADDVIDNSGSLDALAPQVAALHKRYCDLFQSVA